MDGIANVVRQQQSQTISSESHAKVAEQAQKVSAVQVQKTDLNDLVKEIAKDAKTDVNKISTEKDMQNLVKQLNDALAPMNTDLKFGVDSQDIFYVSVIESKSNKILRRFPAEQAQDLLPKMQEVTGILFDRKG